jgi:hypothetical protein
MHALRKRDLSLRTAPICNATLNHCYEFVPTSGIDWQSASERAALRSYNGLAGYLASVTSWYEGGSAIQSLPTGVASIAWMGGLWNTTASAWMWGSGSESGLLVNPPAVGSAAAPAYTAWCFGYPVQPNAANPFMVWSSSGQCWRNVASPTTVTGFLVEYGTTALGAFPYLVSFGV